jgi:hypothetical protein
MKNCYTFLRKNWFRFGLATVFTGFVSLNLQAQTAPAKQWDKTFGGYNQDYLKSLQQTQDGGYILGGQSNSPINGAKGSIDYWLIKIDASGNKVWDKAFGGNHFEVFASVQQTTDGGYIFGGWSASGVNGDKTQPVNGINDFWIVKADANGNKLWDKTFGGSAEDELNSIQQTSDGGYILGGISSSDISGDKSQVCKGFFDYWVIKLDANGNKLWDKTFGGSAEDELNSIQQTPDGGYILGGTSSPDITGFIYNAFRGNSDYWIIKLDSTGNKQWDKTFDGSNIDELRSLQQTLDGGYILGGDSRPSFTYTGDYWVIKLDNNGNKIWDRTIGGSKNDKLNSLQQTADGGYILGGSSNSDIGRDKTELSKGVYDYWIIKLNASGNKIWDKSFGGNSDDMLFSLQQAVDGGYILGGTSSSGIGGDISQSAITIDYWILKLAPDPAEKPDSTEKKPECTFQLFPNPAPGKIKLQLCDLISSEVQLTVFDSIGRLILKEERKAVDHQLTTELALPVAKGMYLLQIKAGSQTSTQKIVVE